MSIIYKSVRIGKGGKPFSMYKLRTLKEGVKTQYNHGENYVLGGKFLRRFRLDEAFQFWNVLKGDMALVGPRPETEEGWRFIPQHIKDKILSIKPGMFGIAGIHFFDEERLLAQSHDPEELFWTKIKPMKFVLECFYVENKCFSLDIWLVWQGVKTAIKHLWSK